MLILGGQNGSSCISMEDTGIMGGGGLIIRQRCTSTQATLTVSSVGYTHSPVEIIRADVVLVACDWWRGSPQLMWRFTISGQGLPCSCTAVKLVREDV